MSTFVVGALVSLATGPQDPKYVNPELVSPVMRQIFGWCPRFVTDWIDSIDVGSQFVWGEKEERLRRRQIIKRQAGQTRDQDGDLKGRNGAENPAFAMEEVARRKNDSEG